MIKHHFQLTEISFGQCLYPWQHYHNDQNTIWDVHDLLFANLI